MVLRRALIGFCLAFLLFPGYLEAKSTGGTSRIKRGGVARASKKRPLRTGKHRKSSKRRRRRDLWPPMHLRHVNTRERLTVRLYDHRGRTIRSSVRKIWRLLRCHHTGKGHRIHWRLVQRLYRISRHFKGKTIQIYSGYRSPRVARTRTSRHTQGNAVDFAIQGISTRVLRDYIRRTYKTKRGLGYYPNSPFVHFDVRTKSAFWVDHSGKGEEPRYAQNPYAVLRQERSRRRLARAAKRTGKKVAEPQLHGPPAPPDLRRAMEPAVKGPQPVGPSPAPIQPRGDRQDGTSAKVKTARVSNVRSVPP